MIGDFFDSNVLLYLLSTDERRSFRATTLLRQGGAISVQVLNEIANVARKKSDLSWPECREFLLLLRGLLEVSPLTVETHELGLDLAERYKLSTCDFMIVAAAVLGGCDRV